MHNLFTNRTPEAAAQQLATVLAQATEWNLATLERLELRKSSPKHDIFRQRHICDELVRHCRELGVSPTFGLAGRPCIRLKEALGA